MDYNIFMVEQKKKRVTLGARATVIKTSKNNPAIPTGKRIKYAKVLRLQNLPRCTIYVENILRVKPLQCLLNITSIVCH